MHWVVIIVTTVILAIWGKVLLNLHLAGSYWIWPLSWAFILLGAWHYGEPEDRDTFRRVWYRLTGWLRLR